MRPFLQEVYKALRWTFGSGAEPVKTIRVTLTPGNLSRLNSGGTLNFLSPGYAIEVRKKAE